MLFFYCDLAVAVPVSFKCTIEFEGYENDFITFVIDVEKKSIELGITKYEIRHANDRYITAHKILNKDAVGGETLVINRVNGRYVRAATYLASTMPDPLSVDQAVLVGKIFTGYCVRPLL